MGHDTKEYGRARSKVEQIQNSSDDGGERQKQRKRWRLEIVQGIEGCDENINSTKCLAVSSLFSSDGFGAY